MLTCKTHSISQISRLLRLALSAAVWFALVWAHIIRMAHAAEHIEPMPGADAAQLAVATPATAAAKTAPTNHDCQLVAHLNEAKSITDEANTTLPRWYDLHYRLLKLLADQAQCQLTVVGSPWPRSLTLLKQGQVDLMLTMSYTEEREQYADFIGPHYLEETVLVVDKSYQTKIRRLADIRLLPAPIGVLRDAWYGDEFAALSLENDYQPYLQYANSVTQKLQLLQKGRVAGIVEDKTQYLEWSRQHPELAARYVVSLTLNQAPVYIVASRKGVPFLLRQRLKRAWFEVYGSAAHQAILAEFGWQLE